VGLFQYEALLIINNNKFNVNNIINMFFFLLNDSLLKNVRLAASTGWASARRAVGSHEQSDHFRRIYGYFDIILNKY